MRKGEMRQGFQIERRKIVPEGIRDFLVSKNQFTENE